MPANPDELPPIVHIDKPLRGIVLARDGDVVRRIEGAHIGTGEISALTDAAGLFHIPAGIRTNRLSVVAPGYEMYYFTILGGLSQRSLVQYFQPDHAYQIETIPGIKDMIAKYK